MAYSEEDLRGLGPEERAALLEDDGQDGQTPTDPVDPVIPDDDADPADPADAVDPADPADPVDPAPADPVDPAPADPAPADPVVDPVVEPTAEKPAPAFKAEPVADRAAKLATIEDQKAALLLQADEGEISLGDALKSIDKLSQEAFDLRLQDNNARIAADMNQQAQQNAWDKECNTFLDANKEYSSSPLRFSALNQMVIALAEKPENFKLTEKQLLGKAHEAVEKELGVAPGKTAKKPVADNPQKKAAESLPELPTLNKLASSELNSTSQDKFAALDRLSGVELEDAIKAMTPRERAEYERGN